MNRPIRNRKELEAAILELENKKRVQQLELKYQFNATWESLKPGNIIRGRFSKVSSYERFTGRYDQNSSRTRCWFAHEKTFL